MEISRAVNVWKCWLMEVWTSNNLLMRKASSRCSPCVKRIRNHKCFGLPHTGRSSFHKSNFNKGDFLHWQRENDNLHDKGQTTLETHSLLLSWQNVLEKMTSSISGLTPLLSRASLLLKDLMWYDFHLFPYVNAVEKNLTNWSIRNTTFTNRETVIARPLCPVLGPPPLCASVCTSAK